MAIPPDVIAESKDYRVVRALYFYSLKPFTLEKYKNGKWVKLKKFKRENDAIKTLDKLVNLQWRMLNKKVKKRKTRIRRRVVSAHLKRISSR